MDPFHYLFVGKGQQLRGVVEVGRHNAALAVAVLVLDDIKKVDKTKGKVRKKGFYDIHTYPGQKKVDKTTKRWGVLCPGLKKVDKTKVSNKT